MDLSPSGGEEPIGRGAAPDAPAVGYRLFVNQDSTVLVRVWADGRVQVAVRSDPDAIWGPPIRLVEEPVPGARKRTMGEAAQKWPG